MRRGLALGLLLGWLLGIGTTALMPSLTYERQTLYLLSPTRDDRLRQATADGWHIARVDNNLFFQLERPRFRLP